MPIWKVCRKCEHKSLVTVYDFSNRGRFNINYKEKYDYCPICQRHYDYENLIMKITVIK